MTTKTFCDCCGGHMAGYDDLWLREARFEIASRNTTGAGFTLRGEIVGEDTAFDICRQCLLDFVFRQFDKRPKVPTLPRLATSEMAVAGAYWLHDTAGMVWTAAFDKYVKASKADGLTAKEALAEPRDDRVDAFRYAAGAYMPPIVMSIDPAVGYAVVPRRPTSEMATAAWGAVGGYAGIDLQAQFGLMWEAALAATGK